MEEIIKGWKIVSYGNALNDFWEALRKEEKEGNLINHETAFGVYEKLINQLKEKYNEK